MGAYSVVRYYPPSGDLYLDVLTRLGGAATFETVDREVKSLDGIRVSVATPDMKAAPAPERNGGDFDRFLRTARAIGDWRPERTRAVSFDFVPSTRPGGHANVTSTRPRIELGFSRASG